MVYLMELYAGKEDHLEVHAGVAEERGPESVPV